MLFGYRDIDYHILHYLDDKSLVNVCRVNKYFNNLCQEDLFWRRRIEQRINPVYNQEDPFSPLTWKQWYIFWRDKTWYFSIERYKLTPRQAYVLLNTIEGNILPGSEVFLSIPSCLTRVIKKNDAAATATATMINRNMSNFKDIYGKFIKEGSDEVMIYDLSPCYDIIDIALTNGYDVIAHQITNTFITYAQRYRNGSELISELNASLSKAGHINFYLEEPKLRIGDEDSRFLTNLIQHKRNKEAKLLYRKLNINDEWERYAQEAFANGNHNFLIFIRDNLTPDKKKQYKKWYSLHAYAFLLDSEEVNESDNDKESYDGITLNMFNEQDTVLSFDEFQTLLKRVIDQDEIARIVYEDDADLTAMLWIYNRAIKKDSRKILREMVHELLNRVNITSNHLILLLNIDFRHSAYNEGFWKRIGEYLHRMDNKGVYLYIISQFAKRYPKLFTNYIINLPGKLYKPNYEIFLVNEMLLDLSPENIINENMYYLLDKILHTSSS